jgi:hypothetical protein
MNFIHSALNSLMTKFDFDHQDEVDIQLINRFINIIQDFYPHRCIKIMKVLVVFIVIF